MKDKVKQALRLAAKQGFVLLPDRSVPVATRTGILIRYSPMADPAKLLALLEEWGHVRPQASR